MPFTEEETKGAKRNPVSDDLFIHRYGGEGPCEKSIRIELRVCLDAKNTQNFLHSTRHIKSLDACMEH
jgi:hypothetical protein